MNNIMILNKQINDENNKIEIKVNKPNFILLFFIFLFCFCTFLFPFVIVLNQNIKIKFSFLITLFVFFGTGLYFLKIIIWNLYGKEVFIVKNKHLMYYFDFKFFKSKVFEIQYENIEIGFSKIDEPNTFYVADSLKKMNDENDYFISFRIDKQEIIKSRIPININYLNLLMFHAPSIDQVKNRVF